MEFLISGPKYRPWAAGEKDTMCIHNWRRMGNGFQWYGHSIMPN